MRLFLTSSGISRENEQAFLDLLGKKPKGLRLAFIPTATKGDNLLMPTVALHAGLKLGEDYRDLIRLGFEITFVDLEEMIEKDIIKTFVSFDVVYVYGGNTFYLMHHANISGFKKNIQEILKNKVYVGVSAGSVIAGPDISLAGWENGDPNNIELKDMHGLSLVSYSILPHWNGIIPKEAGSYPYKVEYIKDGEALSIKL